MIVANFSKAQPALVENVKAADIIRFLDTSPQEGFRQQDAEGTIWCQNGVLWLGGHHIPQVRVYVVSLFPKIFPQARETLLLHPLLVIQVQSPHSHHGMARTTMVHTAVDADELHRSLNAAHGAVHVRLSIHWLDREINQVPTTPGNLMKTAESPLRRSLYATPCDRSPQKTLSSKEKVTSAEKA